MRLTSPKSPVDMPSRLQKVLFHISTDLPAVALCLLLSQVYVAQAAQTTTTDTSNVQQLYEAQNYKDAAKIGLGKLLSEPWNHELRFLVADSLQRQGKFEEAAIQFEALEGTPYAERAMLRLNAIRTNTPPTEPIILSSVEANTPAQPTEPQAPATVIAPSNNRGLAYTLLPAADTTPAHNPAHQNLYDLNAAGDYQALGSEGMSSFAHTSPDDQTRLMVANSLAWTGRPKQAEAQYKLIGPGRYKSDADIGLANLYRWRGRDDLSLPLYQNVLRENPKNEAALEGLTLAKRELQPRTMISFSGSSDSGGETRHPGLINHRWRDTSGTNLFELEGGFIASHQNLARTNQGDLTARYQSMTLPLHPKFELAQQVQPAKHLFGKVGVSFADNEIALEAGRDNWGKTAATTPALIYGLGANHLGVSANHVFDFGQILATADFYSISDGNSIRTTKLDYKPAWTPLGAHIKPYLGMETRDAKSNTLLYWSPAIGFGTAYAGLQAEWGKESWSLFGSGQLGTHLYGEAGTSWSISGGGKYWLTRDIAINLNLWKMQSWRNNSTYRAKSFNLGLEKLWD